VPKRSAAFYREVAIANALPLEPPRGELTTADRGDPTGRP
jgi:hypothetical protein